MKYQRGVTLATLVITVLILFILAGTAFTLLKDDEGILEEAQITQESQELMNLKGSVKAMYSEYKTWSDNGLGKELEVYLNTIENATVQKVADDTYYVKRGNSQVTVYDDGDIYEEEIWDGGSECPVFKEFNWYIYTPSQLKFFADFVNNGNSLAEGQAELLTNAGYRPEDVKMEETTIVYLMNNLDLGARPTDGNWNTTENESKKWIPIGKSDKKVDNVSINRFIGIFEGNHKTIKGVYVNQTANFAGFFGYATNTIQNVSIKDSYIEGGNCMGGLTGSIKILTNCHNINTTVISKEGSYYTIGGITGQISANTGTISNCSNSGKIIANGISSGNLSQCGGITGVLGQNNTITNCENRGKISGRGNLVGGISGVMNSSTTMTKCNNYGEIIGNNMYVGGVSGYVNPNSSVSECKNYGKITGNNQHVGGIMGMASKNTSVSECKNYGDISSISECVGGIAGEVYPENCLISKSMNFGQVKGPENVGGIVGLLSQNNNTTNAKVEKCYNSGNVTGETRHVGGIVGLIGGSSSQATLEKCYNKGVITSENDRIGEIAGYQTNRTGANTLNKLFYLKKSKNLTAIGKDADNVEKQIMSVSDDLTPEQFFTWIESN